MSGADGGVEEGTVDDSCVCSGQAQGFDQNGWRKRSITCGRGEKKGLTSGSRLGDVLLGSRGNLLRGLEIPDDLEFVAAAFSNAMRLLAGRTRT